MLEQVFGKYRTIVIAVAMFILLDASVLVLNFYIASQLEQDATSVNLAGRQRMLSQRMTKSLFDYRQRLARGLNTDEALDEIKQATSLFDQTLTAFEQGGVVSNASGELIHLQPLNSQAGQAAVQAGKTTWQPLQLKFQQFFASGNVDRERLSLRLEQLLRRDNNQLLAQMNDLTVVLEAEAHASSEQLRLIQVAAICLAVINFLLILFHFIRKLQLADSRAEAACRETREILDNVREGLLLLNRDMTVGKQYSASVNEILGPQEYGGLSFQSLLQSLLSDQDSRTASEYIKLLANAAVRETLVDSLNPLTNVEVSVRDKRGNCVIRHLSFSFRRSLCNGVLNHVLVTVQDISELVRLGDEVKRSGSRAGQQLNAFREVVKSYQQPLPAFLASAEDGLVAINESLQEPMRAETRYQSKLLQCQRTVVQLEKSATELQLGVFAEELYQFKEQLGLLQTRDSLAAGDLLPALVMLKHLFVRLEDLSEICELLNRSVASPDWRNETGDSRWHQLVNQLASSQHKQVRLDLTGYQPHWLDDEVRPLLEACLQQLLRNAVSHGIERPQERLLLGKPPMGSIQVYMSEDGGGIRLAVRDDGRGINLQQVRQRALNQGEHNRQEIDSLSQQQLLNLVLEADYFGESGVTNDDPATERGLALVRSRVEQLRGQLRIASRRGEYCELSLLLPASCSTVAVIESA